MHKSVHKILNLLQDAKNQVFTRSPKHLYPRVTLYWARHTWATTAFTLGLPMDTISRALGHSFATGAAVTSVYVRTDTTDIDKANRRVIDYVNK